MTRVRESNDLLHWVRFFLTAVIETSNKGKATFEAILILRQEVDAVILSYGKRAEKAQTLIKHLYSRPAITVNETANVLNVSHQSASSLIKSLVDDGILYEVTGYQRNRIFIFSRYIALFKG